jgi:hypothetical protein
VAVTSDPGDLQSWTLEAQWVEHERERRLFLYFAADETNWWIDRIQTYDGDVVAPGREKWVDFPDGPWARSPLGVAYTGDLDMTGESSTGAVRVHLGGMRLAVNPSDHVNDPLPGAPAPNIGDLACSGALQLPPLAADARLRAMGWAVDWRWQYSTGPNTGTSEVRDGPPAGGFISGTAPGPDGVLVVFVEDPNRPMMPAVTPPPSCP